jgi:hypothetical protein
MLALRIVRFGADPGAREVVPVGTEEIGIGRAPGNTIILEEKSASRHHAKIVPGPKSPLLVDLQSSYGTFVNGRKSEMRVLEVGDTIDIGTTRLLVERTSDDDPTLPAMEQAEATIVDPVAAEGKLPPAIVPPPLPLPIALAAPPQTASPLPQSAARANPPPANLPAAPPPPVPAAPQPSVVASHPKLRPPVQELALRTLVKAEAAGAQVQIRACLSCHFANPAGARFCAGCGRPLDGNAVARGRSVIRSARASTAGSSSHPGLGQPVRSRGRRALAWLLLVAAAVAVGSWLGATGQLDFNGDGKLSLDDARAAAEQATNAALALVGQPAPAPANAAAPAATPTR